MFVRAAVCNSSASCVALEATRQYEKTPAAEKSSQSRLCALYSLKAPSMEQLFADPAARSSGGDVEARYNQRKADARYLDAQHSRLPVKLATGEVTSAKAAEELEMSGATQPRHKLELAEVAAEASAAEAAVKQQEEDAVPANKGVKRRRNGRAVKAEPVQQNTLAHMDREEVLVRRESRKLAMAALAEAIVSNPEKHIAASKDPHSTKVDDLGELHTMARDDDPAVRQLALASELAVWRDIIPSYRIRDHGEEGGGDEEGDDGIGRGRNLKKETKNLRNFEQSILKGYQRYLKTLEALARGYRGPQEAAHDEEEALEQGLDATVPPAERPAGQRVVALTAIKCLCALVNTASHFNFRDNLLASVTQRSSHASPEVSKPCIAALKELFVNDVNGGASSEAVRFIWAVVKSRGVRTSPEMLTLLPFLRLTTMIRDHKRTMKVRDRLKSELKATPGIKADDVRDVITGLKAADAEDREERMAHQTTMLRDVLHITLRLLRSPGNARVLPPVLATLGAFGHLVDVNVVQDLFKSLRELTERDSAIEDGLVAGHTLPLPAALNVVKCALDLISGPGQSLNMQDGMFLQFLYRCLLRVSRADSTMQNTVTVPALEAVSSAFLRRKTPLTWMLTAFVKRVLTLSLALPVNGTMACLTLVRQLSAVHPDILPLFNDCEGDVSAAGVYSHEGTSLDSSTANGTGTVAWELSGLARHYHPHVQSSVRDLIKQRPLPADAFPSSEFKRYDASAGTFTPAVAAPPKQPLVARATAALTAQRKHLIEQAAKDAERGSAKTPQDVTPPDGEGDDLDPLAWLEAAGAGTEWQLSGPIDVLPSAAAAEAHDAIVPSVADMTPYLKATMAAVRARKEAVKKGHHAGDPLLSDVIPGGALSQQLAAVDAQMTTLHLRFGVPPQPAQELYEDARPLGSAGSAVTNAGAAGDDDGTASTAASQASGRGGGSSVEGGQSSRRRGGKKKRRRGE